MSLLNLRKMEMEIFISRQKQGSFCAESEVFTAVTKKSSVFWDRAPIVHLKWAHLSEEYLASKETLQPAPV
jgi:hypothetical protein